jgi:hypothetical protein
MPTPTIPDGELFMNATIWTGDNTTPRSITNGVAGQSFQPDFVWIKSRSAAYQHNLYDSVRGAGAAFALSSDQGAAEGGNSNVYGFLSAFNSNGFAVTQGTAGGGGAPNGNAYTNQSGSTYVAWQWKAGGAAVTNTAGTISSQVSANTTSGFSVVTYTGNGTGGATIGHGLGAKPSFFIIKKRTNSGTAYGWYCYSSVLGATNHLVLDTLANSSASSFLFNDTEPTSVAPYVFTVGTSPATNEISIDYVAYCWTPIAGYSAFGSYTGNGLTDGTFVYTGFRPKFVIFKSTGVSANDWIMYDTSRNTYNVMGASLYPNSAGAENSISLSYENTVDFLSNGFKLRSVNYSNNGPSVPYIYMAFAENPFKYANAR